MNLILATNYFAPSSFQRLRFSMDPRTCFHAPFICVCWENPERQIVHMDFSRHSFISRSFSVPLLATQYDLI